MISEELLSVIYSDNEDSECYVKLHHPTGRVMYFGKEYNNDMRSEIDIHRVSYKCKEWIIRNGYKVQSGYDTQWYCMIDKSELDEIMIFDNISEPEAIFKASEWILEQIKK